jgi:formylglycine-generating enzyme required for sulfatase activity
MKPWIITGIIVLATIALAVPVSASVTGYVTDTAGQPVVGALVNFTDENNLPIDYTVNTDSNGFYEVFLRTSIADIQPIPFTLHQNFPNPFNPATTIPYSLSTSGHVRLDIFNITGQRITTLVDTHMVEGSHTTSWDGRDNSGKAVGAGIYLYSLTSGGMSEARKMLLLDGGGVGAGIASRSYLPHASAKRTDSMTFRVSITGDDIVEYIEAGVAVVDGGVYDFIVQRITVINGLTLVGIPGGTFQMGDEEKPWLVHEEAISEFEIGVYEVTNAQYVNYLNAALELGIIQMTSMLMGTGDEAEYEYLVIRGPLSPDWPDTGCWITFAGNRFHVVSGRENWPVVDVTWYGAKAFAVYYGLDLPTEAEWEHACRGGQQFEYGTVDGIIMPGNANYDESGIRHPLSVGSYPPNPYGLHDMSGNVSEWCHDRYPTGPTDHHRAVRGGYYSSYAYGCRAADRRFHAQEWPKYGLGFRVVRRPGGVTY